MKDDNDDGGIERKYQRLLDWAKGFEGFQCHVKLSTVEGAGHGLVTSEAIPADRPLLVVPAAALLNPLTIVKSPLNTIPAHLFPEPPHKSSSKKRRVSTSQRLNTTQLLALHLALTRDPEQRHKGSWSVYIDTLPRSFRPWHPLTWVVPPTGEPNASRQSNAGKEIEGYGDEELEKVPIAAKENVLRVKARFQEDLEVIQQVLRIEEPFKSQDLYHGLNLDDILWAWLIVNTRSVSLPLGLGSPTDLYNHSLVPLLDFVNHSSTPSQCVSKPRQVPTPGSSFPRMKPTPNNPNPHLVPGRIAFELRSESELRPGQEVRFEYHGHGNTELWAEYGFVESPPKGDWKRLKWAQVDVGHMVDRLWETTELKKEKEEALKACGCWQVNTLTSHPDPGPSHGLQMTLRLIHLPSADRARLKSVSEATTTYLSPENEEKVNETIREICLECIEEGEKALKGFNGEAHRDTEKWGMAKKLWEEQVGVARLVLAGLEDATDDVNGK